jgi:hypothetical protein
MKSKKLTLICSILAVIICISGVALVSSADVGENGYENSEKDVNTYTYADVTKISNVKDNIYNGMINSVDYYDAVVGSFTTSFIREGEDVTIGFKVDIPQQVSLESVKGRVEDLQNICMDETLYSYNASNDDYIECCYTSQLDNSERSAEPDYNICLPHSKKMVFFDGEKAIYDRVVTQADGERGYYYRPDITRTAYASQCIFPQSLGMALLSDMDNWDVTGVRQFLGRNAVVIRGSVTDSDYAQKISSSSFEMTVDLETGVLLEFKGFSDEKLTQHIEMTSIRFLGSGEDNGILSAAKSALDTITISSK